MKNLIIILFMLTLPITGFSQKKSDYEHVVGKFMKFYNNNNSDSIINLFSDSWGETKPRLWSNKATEGFTKEYGKMLSYKFLELYRDGTGDGGGDGLAFFKIVCAKSTHIMGITLNKQNQLLTFRFKTTSPHIDSLLAKNLNSN